MEVGVDDESSSDTVLVLGIGCAANTADRHRRAPDSMKSQPLIPRLPGPSLTLGPYADSALSASFSNVKKEADGGFQDSEESGARRKKLRLSKDQSSLLENRFKEHTTLNPKQKSALAKQLNLRPRQVEVWFQNRRARTKLKQTEVDCELLRRCCEALTDENRRLSRELQELKALKMAVAAPPLYTRLPAATLSVCPSCERVAAGAAGSGSKAAASAAAPESGNALFWNSFGHKAAFNNQRNRS